MRRHGAKQVGVLQLSTGEESAVKQKNDDDHTFIPQSKTLITALG